MGVVGILQHSSRLARRNGSSITTNDVAARDRRERSRQGARDETSGTISPPVAPDPFSIGPKELGGGLYGFLYKVRVENKGAKKIKAIAGSTSSSTRSTGALSPTISS
jgi:hypothetical protein